MRIIKRPLKMKLVLYLSLCLFSISSFGEKSLSLTDYQIQKICKKQKKATLCINKLKEKKSTLQKGNVIEIPVLPFRR